VVVGDDGLRRGGPVEARRVSGGPLLRVHGARAGAQVDRPVRCRGRAGDREARGRQRHRAGGALRGRRREADRVLRTAEGPAGVAGPATVPAAAVRTAAAPAAAVPAHAATDPAAVLPTAGARHADVRPAAQEPGVREPAGRVRRPETRRGAAGQSGREQWRRDAAVGAGSGGGTSGCGSSEDAGSGGQEARQRPGPADHGQSHDGSGQRRGRRRVRRQARGSQTRGVQCRRRRR